MNLIYRLLLGALLCTPALWCQQETASPQNDEYSKDLDQAQAYLSKGLLDKALVVLQEAVQRASAAGLKRRAAEIQMYAASVCREQGMKECYLNGLLNAVGLAAGTDLELPAETHFRLAAAQIALDRGDVKNALEGLGQVYAGLQGVRDELIRRNLESNALTMREKIQMSAASMIDSSSQGSAAKLEEPDRHVLEVLLSDDLSRKPSTVTGSIPLLDKQRPWRRSLFEVALKINSRVKELDERYDNPKLRDLEVAKDVGDRGQIVSELGQIDEAIRLRKSALEVFDRYKVFVDSVIELDRLCDLMLQKKDEQSFIQAFQYSFELVRRIESQTFVEVGQTVATFLKQYESIYLRHSLLLWDQYLVLLKNKNENAGKAMDAFLIHADRSNFRSVRRDLAVYHDLDAAIGTDPALLARLDQKLHAVIHAQAEVDQANAEGKNPEDFEKARGIAIDSPFSTSEVAKQDFITSLEDIKRKETKSIGVDPALADKMAQVTADMGDGDGILMYFGAPDGAMHAAVITAKGTQVYPLAEGARQRLKGLRPKLQRQIVATPQPLLDEISALLLGPLASLPQRLTVVLSSDVLGIPFEALKTVDGQLLVESHEVRYAFGLYRGVAVQPPRVTIRRAMIAGAESFEDSTVEPLPQSRLEVEGIRALLRKLRVEVAPPESLPEKGGFLLSDGGNYQFIHLSTHSRLDSTVPILDALLFPKDKLYAHEFALARLRTSLVVLSSCELYLPRADRLYPVSGITIAALARIAPQVIGPLWKVNATATYLFMLRFYSALVEDGNAAAALARTKRDFASGAGLSQWIGSSGIEDITAADIAEYRNPYYWAPFVLTVGVSAAQFATMAN
jgi:CHAT domain-containing protein